MTPPSAPPHDTFLLLRFSLTATLLVHLLYLGIVIAGSASSLLLNLVGRQRRDRRSLRLSREWMKAVTLRWWVLPLLGVLPYPAFVSIHRAILGSAHSLPPAAWAVPFSLLLAGCLLFVLYRAALLRSDEPSIVPLLGGVAGLLATASAAFLLFSALGLLTNPSKVPLVRTDPVFLLSWNAVAGFLLFLGISFGLAGGLALRLLGWKEEEEHDLPPEYEERIGSAGTAAGLVGALAVPALVVFFLLTFPVTGLSTEVFAMAATVPMLALGAFVLLRRVPPKTDGGRGDHVTEVFVLMLLAVILCYQVGIANAFEGRTAPPDRLAAAEAATKAKPAAKPAAADPTLDKGKKVFETTCSVCHKFDAKVVGPALNTVVPKYKGDVAKLKAFLRDPVKVDPAFPAMPKPAIKEDEIDAVAKYLLSQVKAGK
ncbi:MAG: cytochrome c [Thermodesulfobacteriota bacterium]